MSQPSAQNQNKIPQDYFFGIGIEKYKEHSRFAYLTNPLKDLIEICNLLIEKYGLQRDNITLVQDNRATRTRILQILKNYIDILQPLDRLIIYFSGHGDYSEQFKTTYWIPFDATDDEFTWIADEDIKRIIKQINCRHVLFVSDSCFGANFLTVDKGRNLSFQLQEMHDNPSRWGLAPGIGKVEDGIRSRNSPFVEMLLKKLKENNRNISVSQLHSRLIEGFEDENIEQTPLAGRISGLHNNVGQFIFFIYSQSGLKRIKTSRDQLEELKEEKDWRRTLELNRWRGYYQHLQKYPHPEGKYTEKAFNKYEALRPIFPELVTVPMGKFKMGDCVGDGNKWEGPVEEVTINEFEIAIYPVTNEVFYRFCLDSNIKFPFLQDPTRFPKHPIVNVTWFEAIQFCNWLTKQYQEERMEPAYEIKFGFDGPSGYHQKVEFNDLANGFRLPTESEWEYVAKGGRKFNIADRWNFAGGNDLDLVGWYSNSSYPYMQKQIMPVGGKQPNQVGVYDMCGNVNEWCWDWYDEKAYRSRFDRNNPKGPREGKKKVCRGGSYLSRDSLCRVSSRSSSRPISRKPETGFRIARSIRRFGYYYDF